MFTAIIVDDEPIIRRGLRLMIPWEALGFDEVMEAGDAKQALDIAENTRVSLVITDICMPGIDGLELTQRFLAMQPQISVIVITGYDKFEYAQKCCEIGVRRLVLKPIDETEMTRILSAEVERLRLLESVDMHQMEQRRRASLSERMLRERLLQRLAGAGYTPADARDVRRFLHMDPDAGGVAGVMQLANEPRGEWRGHRTLLVISVEAFVGQMMRAHDYGWCFHNEQGKILLLFREDAPAEMLIEEMRQLVEAEYGLSVRAGVSEPVHHMGDIQSAFAKAHEVMGRPGHPEAATTEQASWAANRIVHEALGIIEANYMQDISVTALAAELHISPNYFSHIFKKTTGKGCNEYITFTRMQAAKQYLSTPHMRCYEIAEAVGYHDTNYFSLSFKKNVGMSPEQYRISLYKQQL